jgi:hypothetical protein
MHKSRATEFYRWVPYIFSITIAVSFLANKTVYEFNCTCYKGPEKYEVHRSFQNCGSSVWDLFHVPFWRLECVSGL